MAKNDNNKLGWVSTHFAAAVIGAGLGVIGMALETMPRQNASLVDEVGTTSPEDQSQLVNALRLRSKVPNFYVEEAADTDGPSRGNSGSIVRTGPKY